MAWAAIADPSRRCRDRFVQNSSCCQPFDEVFGILEEEYRHAIDRIGTARENSADLDAPDSRLAQHLITEYWRGKLNSEDQDGCWAPSTP